MSIRVKNALARRGRHPDARPVAGRGRGTQGLAPQARRGRQLRDRRRERQVGDGQAGFQARLHQWCGPGSRGAGAGRSSTPTTSATSRSLSWAGGSPTPHSAAYQRQPSTLQTSGSAGGRYGRLMATAAPPFPAGRRTSRSSPSWPPGPRPRVASGWPWPEASPSPAWPSAAAPGRASGPASRRCSRPWPSSARPASACR